VRPDDRSLDGGGETREGAIVVVLQTEIHKIKLILKVLTACGQEITPATVDRHCPPTRYRATPTSLSPHKGSGSGSGTAAWHNVQRETQVPTSVRLIHHQINQVNFSNGSRRPSRSGTGLTACMAMGPRLPGCRRLLGPHDTFHAPGSGNTRQATQTATAVSHFRCPLDQSKDMEYLVCCDGSA
jgi:hypothetical protein